MRPLSKTGQTMKGASFCRRVQAKKRRLAPAEAGEVVEGGAGGDDDGVDVVLVHEGAGSVEALLALGEGDGRWLRRGGR